MNFPDAAKYAAQQLSLGLDERRRNTGIGSLAKAQADREAARRASAYWLIGEIAWQNSGQAEFLETGFAAFQERMTNPASAAVVRAAARRFADDKEGGLGSLVEERAQLQSQYARNAAQFADALTKRGEESVKARAQAVSGNSQVAERLEQIDAVMLSQFPEYFDLVRPSPLTVAEARSLMGKDEAALVIVPTQLSINVFTITSEKVSWRQAAFTEDEINTLTQRLLWFAGAKVDVDDRMSLDWEDAVDGGFDGFDRDTAFLLYSELIAPSEAQLDGKEHLFISAAGSLSSLPFSLLVTEEPQGRDDAPQDCATPIGWQTVSH
ncbi:hypothetical protein EH31_15920 [Erythrobacter longus]|uniref:Uncharacterized protein n=1 Tax=Erythrobacter longus TaxID=1044 RepID=A0A074M6B8_ERYLO|nr:hypothetical protein [Erythrobacter longus]KEO88914.1 hypothetical protein EH31_15920 [Erythrobacter longus]